MNNTKKPLSRSTSSKKSLSRSSSSRKRSAKKKIANFLRNKKLQIKSLIDYVVNQSSNAINYKNIHDLIKNQKEKTLVVYRGNGDDKDEPNKIYTGKWFSTTSCEKIAFDEFSGTDCCVFKINILNCKILDVNKFVKDKIGNYADEKEILILGGGKFYKNKDCTELGYNETGIENGIQHFECYYKINKSSYKTTQKRKSNSLKSNSLKSNSLKSNSLKSNSLKSNSLKKIVDEIKSEELDGLIDSIEDLEIFVPELIEGLSNDQKKKIIELIKS
jgi:hypothetical protein